jgi:hypothetical protein
MSDPDHHAMMEYAYGRYIQDLELEIERLKAGIREYACTATDHPCGCYQQFLSERAEIERLRELKIPASRKLLNITEGYLDNAEAEIELLRAALQQFYPGPCPACSGDCASANPPVVCCPMQMARRALEGK